MAGRGRLLVASGRRQVEEPPSGWEEVQPGRFVFLTVRDTGKGISREMIPRIFEPFFTTKAVGDGTGLGLDIVQRIVAQHRGEITCESRVGCTEMIVRLPVPEEV
jgi:signal transduction histidine kinase